MMISSNPIPAFVITTLAYNRMNTIAVDNDIKMA